MRHSSYACTILTLALATVATGCGEEMVQPDGAGITGSWTFTVQVDTATGACAGKENDPAEDAQVSILEAGGNVQALSTWFSDGGNHTFVGLRTGNTVVFSGSYQEEGELLTATYNLTVSSDENSMTGTEEWDWNGQCPESMSDVTATRN